MNENTEIIKATAAILLIPILAFGLYIIFHGHLTPGGGFQGGAIIASSFALFIIAFPSNSPKILKKNLLSLAELLAIFGFALIAILGFFYSGFFINFLANSGLLFGESTAFGPNPGNINTGGIIPVLNIIVGIEVACALTLILLLLLMYKGGSE